MAVRKTFVPLVVVACLAFLVQPAMASFTYTDFSSTAGLSLNDDAQTATGNAVLVTREASDVRGSIYHNTRQNIGAGFTTTFDYRISNLGGGDPGDGMAFVIQDNSPTFVTTAGGGSGMGFHGVNPGALAVEFDAYTEVGFTGVVPNAPYSSPLYANDNVSPTGTVIPGAGPTGGAKTQTGLVDGVTHTAVITYDGVGKTLDLTIDGTITPWGGPVSVDLDPYLAPDGGAYVGFSGGTGGATEEHRLESWSFTEGPPPPPPATELVHIDLAGAGALNSDAVINTGGAQQPYDTVQNSPNGASFLTESAADLLGTVANPAGLPDDGVIPAGTGDLDFDVRLNYHNNDDGDNALTLFNPNDSATVGLSADEQGNYLGVHVFALTAGGDSNLTVTLNYDDATSDSQIFFVEDWFDDGGSAYLIDGLNRANNNGTGYDTRFDPAIFSYLMPADSSKELISIGLQRDSSGNNTVIMGISGVRLPGIIPEPSTMLIWSLLGALSLSFGRRRRSKR